MTFFTSHTFDAFIIGGGLAGIHLALAMERAGQFPLVIDQPDPHSCSRIAAGIINPITGRRFALTWLYEELEPVFTEVYRYWENKWEARFFELKNIYRSVPENKLVNDLDAKLADPVYQRHCRTMSEEEVNQLSEIIHFKAPGYVMHGYQLDTGIFLDHAIRYLSSKGMYVEGQFNDSAEQLEQNTFHFNQNRSDRLIWATGASIVENPYLQWVKMNPNKGEILHLKTKDLTLHEIIKQGSFFIPLDNQKIWLGSYNSWDFKDDQPTSEGLNYLKSKTQILKTPFTISAHLAAVRPAVEDRRPVIGGHPENNHILLFNGFGSKGTSLIPYFAKNLMEHMTEGKEIYSEVSVSRYWP